MDKFQMRINPELLAAVDAQAKADGMTRTEFIVRAMRTRLGNAPSLDGSSRLPNAPAAVLSIPTVKPASSLARSTPAFTPPEFKQTIQAAPIDACHHCGATGVMVVGGLRRCVGCNRQRSAS
jgi:hypothetical protein